MGNVAEEIKSRITRSGLTPDEYASAYNNLRPGSLDRILKAVVDGYAYNPGDSDLDNEQPIMVRMTLGDYRRASQMQHARMAAQSQPEGIGL